MEYILIMKSKNVLKIFRVKIDVKRNGMYLKKTELDNTNSTSYNKGLFIIDPVDLTNNISYACRNIKIIQESFAHAFGILTCQNYENSISLLSRIIVVEKELVERRKVTMGDKNFVGPFIEGVTVSNNIEEDSKKRKIEENKNDDKSNKKIKF
jgi:DNA polymerase sigma